MTRQEHRQTGLRIAVVWMLGLGSGIAVSSFDDPAALPAGAFLAAGFGPPAVATALCWLLRRRRRAVVWEELHGCAATEPAGVSRCG